MVDHDEVVEALRERYPHISPESASKAADALLSRVAAGIGRGAALGTISDLPDGDIEVVVLGVVSEL